MGDGSMRSGGERATDLPAELEERLIEAHFRSSPPERQPAIDALCAAHPSLAERIRAAAADLAEADDLLGVGAGDGAGAGAGVGAGPSVTGVAELPERIGPFRIVRLLGRGGMGAVYLARQDQPIERDVALKVVRPDAAGARLGARFDLERQILARMSHDHVARVLDSGRTDAGAPYLVMEYVIGPTVTDYCDEHGLSIERRIGLFLDVCAGVEHAHQRGVIHRDLKPGNILVTGSGDDASPKVIDFGLARPTEDLDRTSSTALTLSGMVVGTPDYMSPEQVRASEDIDVRTDVYSLGVVLYELLTGELPVAASSPRMADVERAILEQEPMVPSRRVQSAADLPGRATRRGVTGESLVRQLRGDLDAITLRCLEKDRDRRYGAVSDLARDLRSYLADRPVAARRPTSWYRFRKYVRRHRLQVLAAGGIVLGLITGLVALGVGFDRAREGERHARSALGKFDLLSYVVRLDNAMAAEDTLYPAWPDKLPDLLDWRREHGAPLVAAADQVERAVEELEVSLAGAMPGSSPTEVERDRFLLRTLSALAADLVRFRDDTAAGVDDRIRWASTVEQRTIRDVAAGWDEAIAAIEASDGIRASERYAGLRIAPQTGLVPIGMDRHSKLWEFGHPRTGDVPARDPETGELALDADSSVVFVLIPPGRFTMGAQRHDPGAPHYSPYVDRTTYPPHEVELDAFFFAKHELSIAQWRRLSDDELFSEQDWVILQPYITVLSPAEKVSWLQADRFCRDLGLALPTEAQWEYACRAGTTSVWWTGDDVDGLVGAVNSCDQTAKEAGASFVRYGIAPWADGFVLSAPIHSLRANPFGLHHMHGNVYEWCLDDYGFYDKGVRPGDGLRLFENPKAKVMRSGGYNYPPTGSTCADRYSSTPEGLGGGVGLRPARRVR